VDAKAPPKATHEERGHLTFDDKCLHGGPLPSECAATMAAIMGLVGPMQAAATVSGGDGEQLRLLTAFVLRTRPDSRVSRICASMALDAFADNNGGVSRLFLRIASFVESFLAHGTSFLEGIREDGSPATASFLSLLERTTPRSGLLAELRARATCGCLQPKTT
jgi:hypothetical protein